VARTDKTLAPGQALRLAARFVEQGRLDDAESLIVALRDVRPDDVKVRLALGALRWRQDRHAEAVEILSEAVEALPDDPSAALHLGRALEQAEPDRALGHYETFVERFPDSAALWHRLGLVRRDRQDASGAIRALERAAALAPDDAETAHNLAMVRYEAGDFERAAAAFRIALRSDPGLVASRHGLALTLIALRDFDEAIDLLAELVGDEAGFLPAWVALAAAHRHQGDRTAAREALDEALARDPADPDARKHSAGLERDEGRPEAALRGYESVLADRPDDVGAHYNRARLLILLGRVEEGYALYDRWRWAQYRANPAMFRDKGPRPFEQPMWDGRSPEGKRLLVWGEQGVGDEIMYAAMLPALVAAGATVTVECDDRLVPIFERADWGCRFVARAAIPATELRDGDFDAQVPMASLCRWYHPGPRRPQPEDGFLRADGARVERFRHRYRMTGDWPVVGISWSSGNRNNGRERSAELDLWAPLMRATDAHFVSLQYGDRCSEVAAFRDRTGLAITVDPDVDALSDLDGFAAQVAAMDLVVSIDNSTVHMAGALGRPVWTLLPVAPDARWQARGETTPWYPTMRLFRQNRPGDWEAVFRDASGALARFASGRPG